MFSCGISIGYPTGLNKSYFPLCFLVFLCPRKLIPPSKIQCTHYSSCWYTYEFFVHFFCLIMCLSQIYRMQEENKFENTLNFKKDKIF